MNTLKWFSLITSLGESTDFKLIVNKLLIYVFNSTFFLLICCFFLLLLLTAIFFLILFKIGLLYLCLYLIQLIHQLKHGLKDFCLKFVVSLIQQFNFLVCLNLGIILYFERILDILCQGLNLLIKSNQIFIVNSLLLRLLSFIML